MSFGQLMNVFRASHPSRLQFLSVVGVSGVGIVAANKVMDAQLQPVKNALNILTEDITTMKEDIKAIMESQVTIAAAMQNVYTKVQNSKSGPTPQA